MGNDNLTPNEPVDAGHVPITEEFDSPRHTMPDALPVAIALLFVAIVVAGLAWIFRAQPVATGSIDEAYAVDIPDQSTVLATVQLTIKNVTKKTINLSNINITLRTDQGEYSDDAASVTDLARYFQAYPELKEHSIEGLARETKIAPGAQVSGSVIVSFPTNKVKFDARRALIATISFYNANPIEIQR